MEKKLKCTECGSDRIILTRELEYNDGADESHLSNHLVWVDYPECANCGNNEFGTDEYQKQKGINHEQK